MPQIFLSYAREDREFAVKLAEDLRVGGIDVWIDSVNIRAGEPWDQAIEHALTTCSDVLIVLSPDAVSSAAVMDELAYALDEGKRVVPVLHCACRVPLRIKRIQYVDFTASYADGLSIVRSSFGNAEQPATAPIVVVQQPTVTDSKVTSPQLIVPEPTAPEPIAPKSSSQKPSVTTVSSGRGALRGGLVGFLVIFAVLVLIVDEPASSLQNALMGLGGSAAIGALPWAVVGALVKGNRRSMQWAIASAALAVGITWLLVQKSLGLAVGVIATGPLAAAVGALIGRHSQRTTAAARGSAT